MKIAILLNTSWNIYNFRAGLIKHFLAQNHEIVCLAPKDDYSHLLVEMGCTFIETPLDNKGINPLNDLKYCFSLWKILKKTSPDIIFAYTIKPNIYGNFVAKMLNIPVVSNVSGLGTVFIRENFSAKIAHFLYKMAFKFPQKIFFQNEDDLQIFLDKKLLKKSKTALLAGSGINLEEFSFNILPKNNTFTFLLIARLIYDKGILEYIDAIRIIKNQKNNQKNNQQNNQINYKNNSQIKFQLLGKIDTQNALNITQTQVDAWVGEGLIEYLGETNNVKPFIIAADCVVLPSYREGTPRTLLEAAAIGRPIVTTNVAGCKEVVENELNGFLCEPKNAQDLADKMKKILFLSTEKRQEMAHNGRKKVVEQFDEKLVIAKYQQEVLSCELKITS